MKQAELINAIKDEVGGKVSNIDIKNILDHTNDILLKELKSTGKTKALGLGNLIVKARAAHQGHNPRTGEVIEIAAKKVVKFKATKALKEAIN